MTEDLLRKLITQYRVPEHILAHMKKVSAVALYIGQKLKGKGEKIDLIKLRQAALLHDTLKLCDFKELDLHPFRQNVTTEDIHFWNALIKSCHKEGHIMAIYNVLKEIHEDEIAEIILKHRFNCIIEKDNRPRTWEEKVLYYADKRVRFDKIVSIAQRLRDGKKRYFPDGKLSPTDKLVVNAIHRLEIEICRKAGIRPEEINDKNIAVYIEP